MNTLTLSRRIFKVQKLVEQTRKNYAHKKSLISHYNLWRASRQISQLKKELDQSYPEFDDIPEVATTYNLYLKLETLQKQIKS